jgi:hypothetical protein
MKSLLCLILFQVLLCSPSFARGILSDTSKHDTAFVRDGSSFEKAVIINETSESTGDPAEYAWLALNYPGYIMNSQSLVYHNKHPYDILNFQTHEGVSKKIYFDISNFFGKW